MTSALDDDLVFAHRLADAAAAVSLSHFRGELRRWSKPDGSLVTHADMAVEDALREQLGIERPGDAILGEERGHTRSGSRRWILDGIDGTVDFAAGSPEWGTLIALETDGRIVVGVCDQPANQRRYWAIRGGGAFCVHQPATAPRKLRVSGARDLISARTYLPPPEWRPNERTRRIADAMASATNPQPPIDHPALQVATGSYDLVIFFTSGPWDLAAPSLVVEEAGGTFTDLAGRADWSNGTAMFSNGHVHDAALRLLAAM